MRPGGGDHNDPSTTVVVNVINDQGQFVPELWHHTVTLFWPLELDMSNISSDADIKTGIGHKRFPNNLMVAVVERVRAANFESSVTVALADQTIPPSIQDFWLSSIGDRAGKALPLVYPNCPLECLPALFPLIFGFTMLAEPGPGSLGTRPLVAKLAGNSSNGD
jgi:hypothetical protein